MKCSEVMKSIIKQLEGCSLSAYKDAAGYSTIGYGHLNKNKYVQITEEEADALFESDIFKVSRQVERALGDTSVTQNQFDALVSFVFNLGIESLRKSSLLRYILNGKFDKATSEFLLWKNVRVNGELVPLRGLKIRRYLEAAIFSLRPMEEVVSDLKDGSYSVTHESVQLYSKYVRSL